MDIMSDDGWGGGGENEEILANSDGEEFLDSDSGASDSDGNGGSDSDSDSGNDRNRETDKPRDGGDPPASGGDSDRNKTQGTPRPARRAATPSRSKTRGRSSAPKKIRLPVKVPPSASSSHAAGHRDRSPHQRRASARSRSRSGSRRRRKHKKRDAIEFIPDAMPQAAPRQDSLDTLRKDFEQSRADIDTWETAVEATFQSFQGKIAMWQTVIEQQVNEIGSKLRQVLASIEETKHPGSRNPPGAPVFARPTAAGAAGLFKANRGKPAKRKRGADGDTEKPKRPPTERMLAMRRMNKKYGIGNIPKDAPEFVEYCRKFGQPKPRKRKTSEQPSEKKPNPAMQQEESMKPPLK